MGYGWGFGQCAPKCTHRKLTDDPEILWSAGVANCANPIVLDSCIDASGNVYIVGRWQDKTNFGFAQQIDPSDGSAVWTKHYRGTIHCCTTDGTSLWIAGESLATDNLFKLDPDDGETVWSVTSWHQVIYDCIHDGAGKVYVCGTVNPYQSGESFATYTGACGYASLYNSSGVHETSFGGMLSNGNYTDPPLGWQDEDQLAEWAAVGGPVLTVGPTIAYSIDLDSEGNIYVGSTPWRAANGSCDDLGCGPGGTVAKFRDDHSLEWLFGSHTCGAVRLYDGDLYCGFCKTTFAVSGVPYRLVESTPNCQIERWTTDEVTRVWGRTLQVDKPFVEGEDIRPVGVTDIEVSDTGVYVTHQWWVSKLDHSGTYEWSTRHAKADVGGEERGTTYYTVELDPSEETETLYVGGRGANCTVDDQDDSETPASGDCEPTWVCAQRPNTRGPHGGIYSWICTGKQIPCSVDDIFYGSGCFSEVEPVNYTWLWQDDGTLHDPDGYWWAEFDIPCGESSMTARVTARQVSDTACSGWEVLAGIIGGPEGCTATMSAATVTACENCEPEDGGYVFDAMPFRWAKSFGFESCVCCGEGGGGNTPPGVTVDCCENEIPLTLTAEFTGCITGIMSLVYDSGTGRWTGTETFSGCPIWQLDLECSGSTWAMTLVGGTANACGVISGASPTSCDPLIIEFTGLTQGGSCPCCPGGSFAITVTE